MASRDDQAVIDDLIADLKTIRKAIRGGITRSRRGYWIISRPKRLGAHPDIAYDDYRYVFRQPAQIDADIYIRSDLARYVQAEHHYVNDAVKDAGAGLRKKIGMPNPFVDYRGYTKAELKKMIKARGGYCNTSMTKMDLINELELMDVPESSRLDDDRW